MLGNNGATVEQRLDHLAELQSRRDMTAMEYQRRQDALLAPLAEQLLALHLAAEAELDALNAEITLAQETIKAAVVARGETVKGLRLKAVYCQGRVSWDSKGLAGYALAHPEIQAFRAVGLPSVHFDVVK